VDPGSAPPAANARASPVATARYPRAALIARLFLTLPLVCPRYGADRRIIAVTTETAPMRRILCDVGEPAEPPRSDPSREPPAWDAPPVDAVPDWEAVAQPSPECIFDQEVQW
jgi:hypothetical protein